MTPTRHTILLVANFITCSSASPANTGVTHKANFCRQHKMRKFVKNLTYVSLRWADVAVCRSADTMKTANIWRTGAMSAEQSRCSAKQRDNLSGPDSTGGGRTSSLLRAGVRERRTGMCRATCSHGGGGGGGLLFIPQTTTYPSLSSHSPQIRWTFAASSLFPKVESPVLPAASTPLLQGI